MFTKHFALGLCFIPGTIGTAALIDGFCKILGI